MQTPLPAAESRVPYQGAEQHGQEAEDQADDHTNEQLAREDCVPKAVGRHTGRRNAVGTDGMFEALLRWLGGAGLGRPRGHGRGDDALKDLCELGARQALALLLLLLLLGHGEGPGTVVQKRGLDHEIAPGHRHRGTVVHGR